MISILVEAVLGWLSSMLFGWMRTAADKAQGEKDRAAQDIAAAQQADQTARTIEDRDSHLSDDELDKRLRP